MRVLALASVFAFACGSATPAPPPPSNHGGTPGGGHEHLASIERTACFGWCPIYKLTVYRDGVVEYDGDSYVKTKGKATGQLTVEQLTAIDELFQKNGYMGFADTYTDASVTDMPSVHTSYSAGGKTKSIQHYLGDQHAPEQLSTVEEGLDHIVQVERWIGTEDEREKMGRH